MDPPFKTARAQSELFAVQWGQKRSNESPFETVKL